MDRGRGIRRSRGGRPFIRGYYRGRTRMRRPMGYRSRTSSSRDKYEYNDNDRSDSRERSWESPSGTDKDTSKEKRDEDDTSPVRSKWEKDDDASEKNDERYIDKKDYYHESKYYRRPTGHPYRGQRRPYQNNYWDRSNRGRHHSPQSQYRTRPYHSPPRHRRYSRSPDRRRSPSRYRSRSRSHSRSRSPSLNRSRRFSPPKQRSPKRRSPSRRPRSPSEIDQPIEKNKIIKLDSDNENNSDDFVEKLKASKGSKTPGRIEYSEKSDDEYWIESDKNNAMDTKKINRPDYSSKGSKTPGRSESSNKGSKTPGRSESSNKGSKTPGRQEHFGKGSKTPGRPELTSADNDEYWVKSQTSKPTTKNLYSSSWDDSPVREKSIPKMLKTPGRKDYAPQGNDDYWINSPPNESKIDHLSNDNHSKKNLNKDSSTMYVQELSSSDSEPVKTKRVRSMSLTNSDKSDTPPLHKEQSNKIGSQYSRTSSRGSNSIIKEPPLPSLPVTPNNVPVYNSQWPDSQNSSTSYSSTTNYVQPQSSQFASYQQRQQVPVQSSQWYQSDYQQYSAPFQQFQQYDQKTVAYNPVRSNLEPVEGYQSANQGLYNIDLKQVVDISKPPPNITPITPVPETSSKNSQDRIFEMQRETYIEKLFNLKKELETLQIQYDTYKADNSDGRRNAELKNNRKAQDDVNGKIKGINNIIEVLNTMIPKDSSKEVKKVETKKITAESEVVKIPKETLLEEGSIHKHHRRSTSSSSVELKKKRNKSVKTKKSSKVHSSDADTDSKKSYKSKELIDTSKKKNRIEKLPQFNYVYCDSCIHWCQPCNIFPKTAKEYLTHLHSESHKTTLEELNVVELPWHDTQTQTTQPEKNPELPNKRVPIKGLEFFIGTSAWYCKLCDTWIGDLHCASAHFKSKRHNDLYAELISKEPNWEIDWLTKRTRAFEKSLSQTSIIKPNVIKEDKFKDNITESKVEKSFFEKELRKEREKEKLRERDRDRDRDRYKKELNRKITDLKNQLSPDKDNFDTNNVSISDWMKPVDLPVEKSMITLKESVQKSKERLNKHKTDETDELKSRPSNVHVIKKQKLEEPKTSPITQEKKEENFNVAHRSKIKLPFIGKMPFAKPTTRKTNSSMKDIPSFTVESSNDESKDNYMDTVAMQKKLIENLISAANEKKVEKQILPVDMDIDDDNENNEAILSTETNSVETQLTPAQSGNQIHQMYNQPPPIPNALPQDLNTALNMIFPCNESSSGIPSINTPMNLQTSNPLIQHFNMSYDVTNNLNLSPERKKKKNAPSQRKRRHLKKIMGKEDESTKDEDDDDDDDDKADNIVIQRPKDSIKKTNGNESEGDELAMLGIDVEDMAAQYY